MTYKPSHFLVHFLYRKLCKYAQLSNLFSVFCLTIYTEIFTVQATEVIFAKLEINRSTAWELQCSLTHTNHDHNTFIRLCVGKLKRDKKERKQYFTVILFFDASKNFTGL